MTENSSELSRAAYLESLNEVDRTRVVGCADFLKEYFLKCYSIPATRMAIIVSKSEGFRGIGNSDPDHYQPYINQPIINLDLLDSNPPATEWMYSLERYVFQAVMYGIIYKLVEDRGYSYREHQTDNPYEDIVFRINARGDMTPIHISIPSLSCPDLDSYLEYLKEWKRNSCILAAAETEGEPIVEEEEYEEDLGDPEDDEEEGLPFW